MSFNTEYFQIVKWRLINLYWQKFGKKQSVISTLCDVKGNPFVYERKTKKEDNLSKFKKKMNGLVLIPEILFDLV